MFIREGDSIGVNEAYEFKRKGFMDSIERWITREERIILSEQLKNRRSYFVCGNETLQFEFINVEAEPLSDDLSKRYWLSFTRAYRKN